MIQLITSILIIAGTGLYFFFLSMFLEDMLWPNLSAKHRIKLFVLFLLLTKLVMTWWT